MRSRSLLRPAAVMVAASTLGLGAARLAGGDATRRAGMAEGANHLPGASLAGAAAAALEPASPPLANGDPLAHAFVFARAMYSDHRSLGGYGRRRWAAWATDYPKADIQFLVVARRLVDLDAYPEDFAIRLDDPELRRFPFLYAVEVGNMALTDAEVAGLRDYLEAGGFLFVDDFWGTYEWRVFEEQIRRVLPGRPIVDLELDHEVFSTFYHIEEVIQVPNIGNGRRGGPTWERDGYTPMVRGIEDDDGRLMVLISWNSDLGDAWEWAEDPYYPLRYSTFAFELGVNAILYAMSH